MKCWIIWCAHPLVRLLLPHICIRVHKQICTIGTHTHTESTHTQSFSHSHIPAWSCFTWSNLVPKPVGHILLTNWTFQTTLNTHRPHTHTAGSKFHLSDSFDYSHSCSTQPTHLLLPPTALDVLARVFPIKLFYYEPSPFGLDVSKWLSSAVQHGRHSIRALSTTSSG